MCNKSHAIIIIINTKGQIVQVHLIRKKCLTDMWHGTMQWKVVATLRLEPNKVPVFVWNKSQNLVLKRIVTMVHYRTTKWVNENSFTKIRTNCGTEMVSSGSHWPSKVVWHLCSQSESGRKNAFSGREFSVWPAKRWVLQKELCHLRARIDNNWK